MKNSSALVAEAPRKERRSEGWSNYALKNSTVWTEHMRLDANSDIRNTHTHTLSFYQIGKQIQSKALLLQEIVKALASMSEYVVFVNT